MLDLQRLRLLSELRHRGTITAVAAALSYSPSTVSHQLSELQREVGVRLFEREGRRLRLTEAAYVLAGHADELLVRVGRAEAEVAAAAGVVGGVVRVVAFQSTVRVVAEVIKDLAERHSALRIETVVAEPDEALEALDRHGCDVAVCDEFSTSERRRPAGLHFQEVHSEQVFVVLPREHAAAGEAAVRLGDLAEEVWAGGAPDSSHGRMVTEACRTHGGFEPDLRHQTADALSLISLVAAGQAVTLLPRLAIPHGEKDITALPVEGLDFTRRIHTVVRDHARSRPALTAVTTALYNYRLPEPPP